MGSQPASWVPQVAWEASVCRLRKWTGNTVAHRTGRRKQRSSLVRKHRAGSKKMSSRSGKGVALDWSGIQEGCRANLWQASQKGWSPLVSTFLRDLSSFPLKPHGLLGGRGKHLSCPTDNLFVPRSLRLDCPYWLSFYNCIHC